MKMERLPTFSLLFCVKVLTFAYLICPCEPTITLTSDQNVDGSWTFTEGEDVTLKCVISPYSGTLKWKYDSTESATCGIGSCGQKMTGDGAFSFTYDLVNGVFEWSISPMKPMYNNKVFECNDGNNSEKFTAIVRPIATYTAKVNVTDADSTKDIRRVSIAALVIGCLALTMASVSLGLLCWKSITYQEKR